MLTNMENQLKEQNATDRFDEVLQEIPLVRQDLGFIPLVTPTSQIVGTQAVINVLSAERYKTITKESAGLLKGEYGATPAPVNKELQARVLQGAQPITCRPADLLKPEMNGLIAEVKEKAKAEGVPIAENVEEDALIYGLFAQVGWKFITNRGNPEAFEPPPNAEAFAAANASKSTADTDPVIETYTVNVDGKNFNVAVAPGTATLDIQPVSVSTTTEPVTSSGAAIESPMAGTILKINVHEGSVVVEGDVVIILEAMKMETEIRAKVGGTVSTILVKEGAAVSVGETLLTL
jgi:oxaloacetate decarboxylase (Na+ extruding) subunit alpha